MFTTLAWTADSRAGSKGKAPSGIRAKAGIDHEHANCGGRERSPGSELGALGGPVLISNRRFGGGILSNLAWTRIRAPRLAAYFADGFAGRAAMRPDGTRGASFRPASAWARLSVLPAPEPQVMDGVGIVFIPLYVGSLLLFAWLALRPDLLRFAERGGQLAPAALRAAALLACASALLIALYSGAEVMVIQARPLWNTPLLPMQLSVSALAAVSAWS